MLPDSFSQVCNSFSKHSKNARRMIKTAVTTTGLRLITVPNIPICITIDEENCKEEEEEEEKKKKKKMLMMMMMMMKRGSKRACANCS